MELQEEDVMARKTARATGPPVGQKIAWGWGGKGPLTVIAYAKVRLALRRTGNTFYGLYLAESLSPYWPGL